MDWKKRVLILAAASGVAAAVLAGVGSAVGAAVPSNTSLPSIGGAARDGSLLTAFHGSWTGGPTSFSFAWERCDQAGAGCVAIAGATSKRYTATTADVQQRLRVVVEATNASGTGTATSRTTDVVLATGQAPTNTTAPSIGGTPKEGSVLTARRGAWTGTQPISFAYQWQRCDSGGGSCADIAGATSSTYTAASTDVAGVLLVKVTATNSRGSTTAASQTTAIVAPATTSGGGGHVAQVAQVSLPTLLLIDNVKFSPSVLVSRAGVVASFHVSDTRGFSVQGALVYALGLPYGWTLSAPEVATDDTGWATITMHPTANLPLRPGALVIFVRARKPGDNLLSGVSTRRLVQVSIR